MPDQHSVTEVQMLEQSAQVGGKRVVVVADIGLAGPPESAAIVRDDAVAGVPQDGHLPVPSPATERIPVDQDDGLTRTVVLVVDFDVGGVLSANDDFRHANSFLSERGLHPGPGWVTPSASD